ncbi:MAG: amidohydrolase family protein, partial [Desulfatiglandales bacterium]
GLELAVPLTLSLVREGYLSIVEAIKRLSLNPFRILNLDGGTISLGKRADITIIDPELEWVVSPSELRSKSKNTPFLGKKMKGRAIYTICGGKVIFERN